MAGISSKSAGGLENKTKYNSYELNTDFDINLYETFYRSHDPQIGRFWQIDPKPSEDISLYAAMRNNPILYNDFLGDTTTYYNIETNEALGTINNAGSPVRTKINSDIYSTLIDGPFCHANFDQQSVNNDFVERVTLIAGILGNLGFENLIANETGELTMSFDGEANPRNNAQGDGTLNVKSVFDDGSTLTIGSYQAVGGPYGNGAPENGNYTADNLSDRSPTGWYSPAMNRDGVGFSMNLNPQFETGRTLERIHPDGRVAGTQGCIGLQCNAAQLTEFRNTMQNYLQTHTNISVNINIANNPNNNGRGRRVRPNGE